MREPLSATVALRLAPPSQPVVSDCIRALSIFTICAGACRVGKQMARSRTRRWRCMKCGLKISLKKNGKLLLYFLLFAGADVFIRLFVLVYGQPVADQALCFHDGFTRGVDGDRSYARFCFQVDGLGHEAIAYVASPEAALQFGGQFLVCAKLHAIYKCITINGKVDGDGFLKWRRVCCGPGASCCRQQEGEEQEGMDAHIGSVWIEKILKFSNWRLRI